MGLDILAIAILVILGLMALCTEPGQILLAVLLIVGGLAWSVGHLAGEEVDPPAIIISPEHE